MRPQPGDYLPYFDTYISKVKSDDLLFEFEKNGALTQQFMNTISDEKGDFSYAPEKWTVKQVLLHLADCERVFAYRALTIARGDKTSLPGFDENLWADNSISRERSLKSVIEELLLVRQNTLALFKTFDENTLLRKGIASNNPVNVIALGFIIAGHEIHHINVLKDRYKL